MRTAALIAHVLAISIGFAATQAIALEKIFVFVSQADSPGNDYSKTVHSTFEKCVLSCERDTQCNAFTYNQIKSECFLKTAPAQWTVIRLGAITGIRLSPLPLPEAK